jgi:dolichol-phosphate mannosyltransferase
MQAEIGMRAGESNPMTSQIDVVIPAFNEATCLEANVRQIVDTLSMCLPKYRLRFILVDDGSIDGTSEAMQRLRTADSRIQVLRFTRNFGKEAALSAGLQVSDAPVVVTMDSDLQHPPQFVKPMVEAWEKGALVVEAVKRARQKEGVISRVSAEGFYTMFERFSGMELRGATDFKLLDRKVVSVYRTLSETRKFYRGLVRWSGFPTVQLEFDVPPRAGGESRWSTWRLFGYAWNNLCSFSSLPLRLIGILGIGAIAVSSILLVITLVRYVLGEAVTGFTTVIFLLVLFSGVQLICLGILGAFVGRMYDELKRRPEFLVYEASGGIEQRFVVHKPSGVASSATQQPDVETKQIIAQSMNEESSP